MGSIRPVLFALFLLLAWVPCRCQVEPTPYLLRQASAIAGGGQMADWENGLVFLQYSIGQSVAVGGLTHNKMLLHQGVIQPLYGYTNGRNEEAKEALYVFPNPCTDYFYLAFSASVSGEIRLYNASGLLLQEVSTNGMWPFKMEAGHLAPGIYILHFVASSGSYTQKIIKT